MTPRQEEVRKLREQGLTYREIGEKIGISIQRVQQILKPEYQREYQREYRREYRKTPKYKEYQKEYQKEYRKTPKQKEYQKHVYHIRVRRMFRDCERCKGRNSL